MAENDYVTQVRGASPFPWRQMVHPNGIVQIIDSENKEVPIFTLTNFAMFITNVMNAQKEKTPCEQV